MGMYNVVNHNMMYTSFIKNEDKCSFWQTWGDYIGKVTLHLHDYNYNYVYFKEKVINCYF